MITKERAKAFKHSLVVDTLSFCKTILQSGGRLAISSLLISSMISCGPGGGAPSNIQYITNNGADKKLPEDGGYKGTGGTGDGGGGQGILCSADTKNPQYKSKLFVRDIFEAIYNSKLTMKKLLTSDADGAEKVDPEAIKLLINILKNYFGPALPQLELGREKFWTDFSAKISFLDEDAKLYPSQDANSPIALPSGCQIVQIAYWDDSTGKAENGTLYVDKALWKKLDAFNKAALLAHEYFFKEARRAGHKNSDFVRARVGQLFSETSIPPMFASWKSSNIPNRSPSLPVGKGDLLFCVGRSDSDPSAVSHIYFERNTVTIPFLRSTAINLSSLQTRTLPANSAVRKAVDFHHLLSKIHRQESRSTLTFQEKYILNLHARGSELPGLYDDLTFSNWLDGAFTDLEIQPNPIWKSSMPSSASDIQVSLTNPVRKFESKYLLKDDKEAASIFYQLLEEEVRAAENKVRNSVLRNHSFEEKSLLKAIAVLNEEVSQHVANGVFPESFPKWSAALGNIADAIFEYDPVPNYKARFLQVGNLQDYPVYLYKMKLGALTKSDLNKLSERYSKLFSKSLGYEINSMKLKIQNTQNTIEFDLACYDYGSIYSDLSSLGIIESMPTRTDELKYDLDPYKFRVFNPQYDSVNEDDDPETILRKTENRNRALEFFNENLKRTISLLSGRPGPQYSEDFDCTAEAFESLLCDSKSILNAKLKRVNRIEVLSCRDFDKNVFEQGEKEPGAENENHCYIFHLQEDDSFYLINDQYSEAGSSSSIIVRAIDKPVDREQSRPGEYP